MNQFVPAASWLSGSCAPSSSWLGSRVAERASAAPKGVLVASLNSFVLTRCGTFGLRLIWMVAFALVLCGTWLARAGAPEPASSLLEGAKVIDSSGVTHVDRLIDRVVAPAGDYWRTDISAPFSNPNGAITWDLGQEVEIHSAYLQGDNNDTHLLSISSDNKTYRPLWTAPVVDSPGMRDRSSRSLNAKGRYVRLQARGGDRMYALTEVRLSSDPSADLGSQLTTKKGTPVEEQLQDRIVWFGIISCLCILFARRGQKLWVTLGLAAIAALATAWCVQAVLDIWPVGQREISLMRATAAAIALVAVLREALAPRRQAADTRVIRGALTISATLAVLTFVNLLNPQFWDHKNNHKSVVHNFDMRVYYPIAKYFRELQFDGLYEASVAAYVDDVPGANLDSLNNIEIRDLNTHHMVKVRNIHDKINAVRQRFTPERWQSFVEDMRYFRETMGRGDYFGSMHDHGGNATPVWFVIARFLFYFTTANNTVLILGALLDPLLLGLMFYAIKRTFGWRTMLVAITLFGANDFHMFGSNWVGATLRHDWMAYIGLGVCALGARRWTWAGVLLAMASLIRAFPAFTLITLTFPALGWLYSFYDERKRLPRWSEIREAQGPTLKVAKSAAITVVSAVVAAAIVLGPMSWPRWWHKVNLLERDAHTNHESLRMFLSFDPTLVLRSLTGTDVPVDWSNVNRNWQIHQPIFVLLVALGVLAVFAAARTRKLHQAATLGLILIPLILSPANYYCHVFFLLCLVAIERERGSTGKLRLHPVSKRDAWIWATLLGLCVAQYRTVEPFVRDLGLHFLMSATFMLLSFAVILALLLHKKRRRDEVEEVDWA